jgi:hypothetical protein
LRVGLCLGGGFAGFAQKNLHVLPVEPSSFLGLADPMALKTPQLAFWGFA